MNYYREMFHVSKEVIRKTLENHNTNEKNLENDVDIIRNWITTQPHFPEVMDDAKITRFIILNKCSIEKTKQKIDNYYSMSSSIPELFDTRNPKLPNMKKFIEVMYCFVHPELLHGLHRCIWLKPKFPNTLMLAELAMYSGDIAEVRLTEDWLVGNDIWIGDLKNITLADVAKVTPTLIIKIMTIYQNILSLRFKAVFYINSPPYFANIWAFIKTLLKPKIFEKIEIHQDEEILKTLFRIEDLPMDYGGKGLSMDELNEMTWKKVISYQDRFDELDNLKVNEELRPDKLDNDEILGFHGNFKKLSVD